MWWRRDREQAEETNRLLKEANRLQDEALEVFKQALALLEKAESIVRRHLTWPGHGDGPAPLPPTEDDDETPKGKR